MTELQEKIFFVCTHSGDDPQKAAFPFVMANASLAMDVKATICLQGNGVYLALKGYADKMLSVGGFPPMKKLIADFVEQGGRMLVCVPCIKERQIDEKTDLIEGAETTAAGVVITEALESKAVFTY
jgi:predicted peroxiredoxin